MSSPAIILRSKYIVSEDSAYKDYINYMNRTKAKFNVDIDNNKENDFTIFHSYLNYMDDSNKDGRLFDKSNDILDNDQANELKNTFSKAQENGSPMWQDVISFDNDFLEDVGIYDSYTGYVDERKLKNITRDTVREMADNEKLDINSLTWTGAIHHNTDNIHIHLAMVEPYPSREIINYNGDNQYRGNRKLQSFEKMKRCVANSLYNRNKDLQKIDKLIRDPIKEKRSMSLSNNEQFIYHFHEAIKKLPSDKRQWSYGYNSVNDAREHIDKISKEFMENYFPDHLQQLYEELDNQVNMSKKLYGEGSRANEYKDNKINDLKKRLGNAVLKEMKEYDKFVNNTNNYRDHNYGMKTNSLDLNKIKSFRDSGEIKQPTVRLNSNLQQYSMRDYSLQMNFSQLKRAMRKSVHEFENEQQMEEFDRMQEGFEMD